MRYQKKHDKDVKTTTMRFDSALYAQMQARADERGVSLSALVHEAVRRDMDAPAAGGGYLTQIDRFVASGRDPVLTVTATLGEPRAYHGRVDVARWAEFRGYGKLPLLLTFEYQEEQAHWSETTPAEVALGHVTAVVEDPGGSYFRDLVRPGRFNGEAIAANMNDPALMELRTQRAAAYQITVVEDLGAATTVRDLYARLQVHVQSPRFEREFMGPRIYACSFETQALIQRAEVFWKADVGSMVHTACRDEMLGVEPACDSKAIYLLMDQGRYANPYTPDEVKGWFKVEAVHGKREDWPNVLGLLRRTNART